MQRSVTFEISETKFCHNTDGCRSYAHVSLCHLVCVLLFLFMQYGVQTSICSDCILCFVFAIIIQIIVTVVHGVLYTIIKYYVFCITEVISDVACVPLIAHSIIVAITIED